MEDKKYDELEKFLNNSSLLTKSSDMTSSRSLLRKTSDETNYNPNVIFDMGDSMEDAIIISESYAKKLSRRLKYKNIWINIKYRFKRIWNKFLIFIGQTLNIIN